MLFPSQHSFFFSLISHFEYYDVINCFLMMPNYVNLFFPLSWTLFWLSNYWINYSLPRNAIWSVSFLMIMYILNYISLASEFVFTLQHLEDNELRVLATYMALYRLVCIILSSWDSLFFTCSWSYIFIHYALLVAYVARSSDILTNFLGIPLYVLILILLCTEICTAFCLFLKYNFLMSNLWIIFQVLLHFC